jgi:Tyrosyl-tRNA synthetase
LPSVTISKNQIEKEINILNIVILSKMLSSKGEIRRMIKNKGIKINNVTIDNEKRMISKKDFKENSMLKLSLGKKKHTVFKIN